MRKISVHRFHDTVAVSLTKGPTHYTSAATARQLAAALILAAESVEREGFGASRVGMLTVEGAAVADGSNEYGELIGYVVPRRHDDTAIDLADLDEETRRATNRLAADRWRPDAAGRWSNRHGDAQRDGETLAELCRRIGLEF